MRTAFISLIVAFAATLPAAADMAVSPLRHVLDSQTREARFVVSNPTPRILDGRASWVDLTATPTGYDNAAIAAREDISAAPWFTLRPSHFRLEPGARIEIIVALRDGIKSPKGERRSHLLIETAATRTLMRKASDSGLQVDIDAGVSVPVILRGPGNAAAEITGTKLLRDSEGLLLLSTAITPQGAHSTFGRLTASFSANGGAPQVLATRENVVGYTDADVRLFELPLGFFTLGAGQLTLRYEGAAEFEGRVFDERKFEIAPPD